MYPSFNNEDTNLFTFSENIYTNPTSTNYENLSSSSPLFNYFPWSPLSNYSEDALFFQQFNEILHKNIDDQDHEASDINMIKFSDDKCSSNVNEVLKLSSENHDQEIQKKGRCKKDKHSKILTANGSSRGRRMRLSIDVAKEFFHLQDMLGFDKASKTIEWLLEKSKNDIKELKKHNSSPSASALSALDEIEREVAMKEKTKEGKGVRKLAVSHSLARELRKKARARARERTSEKKRIQPIGGCTQQMNMGSCNPFLSGDESDAAGIKFHKIYTSNYPASYVVEELPQKSGDSCFITNTWNNSSTILNHQYNSRATSIEHQFPAFQYDGKPWEGFL